jgi:predicted transcriptional regulator
MNVKDYIRYKNITEVDFAKKIGVAPQYINYYTKKNGVPNKILFKMLFLCSGGRITPNGQYNIKEWKQELKQLQKDKKEKKLEYKQQSSIEVKNE